MKSICLQIYRNNLLLPLLTRDGDYNYLIKFTLEHEHNDSYPFLDLLNIRNDVSLIVDWYRCDVLYLLWGV